MQPEYKPSETQGNLIFLSGTSSSGKSSVARELEDILGYRYISRDDFREAYELEHASELLQLPRSAVSSRLDIAFYGSIAELASTGMNLIVDGVIGKEYTSKRAARILADYEVTLVLLSAPIDVLEIREKQRGDRTNGIARSQLPRVHRAKQYDLEVDTSTSTPKECALKIFSYLQHSQRSGVLTSNKFWDDSYRPALGEVLERGRYFCELEKRDPMIRNGLEYLGGLLQKQGLLAIVTGSSVLGEPDSDIDIAIFGDRKKVNELLLKLKEALKELKARNAPLAKGIDIRIAEDIEYCETRGSLIEFGNFDIIHSTEFAPSQIGSYTRRLLERGKSYVPLTEFTEPAHR